MQEEKPAIVARGAEGLLTEVDYVLLAEREIAERAIAEREMAERAEAGAKAEQTPQTEASGANVRPVRRRKKKNSEQVVRKRVGKFFRDKWEDPAETIMDVMRDEASKPGERLQAAKIALEFGFGKPNTQEAPPVSGRPKIKMDGLPSVEEMKRRASARASAA